MFNSIGDRFWRVIVPPNELAHICAAKNYTISIEKQPNISHSYLFLEEPSVLSFIGVTAALLAIRCYFIQEILGDPS